MKQNLSTKTRTESDLIGSREVPESALYGVQTLRGIENFRISKFHLNEYPLFIQALAITKMGAAVANRKLELLTEEQADAILKACKEVLEGKHHEQFPVDMIQGEMLKAVLKDKDTTGKFLLSFGDTIVEWYRTAKARQTFLHKRTWQKNLKAFVHSLDKDDIAFEDIDENFGEEYKLFLKRDQGRIDSYVNHCLLWLNMLMYKAVDRSIIRFNPIARIGYEKKAAPKMTHISKADFVKMLSTPMADERTELARRCFIFASLTSLSYIDVKKLYPHHISENSEGRKFIRKEREKTGVEFFVPLHPIAEKILSLYNTTDDSKPVFPLGEKKDIYLDVHTLGMVLGISNKLGFHASRHTFGVLMLNEDIPIGSIAKMMGHADITSTQVYAQVTEQKISNDMDKLIAKRERNRLSNEKTIGK